MNRVLLEPGELAAGPEVRLAGRRARHLLEVLRVTPGQLVRIGVLDGATGTGTVVAAGGGQVALRCALDGPVPPPPRVDLVLALPRPKVLRRLWTAAASLGVGRIVLVNASEVERNYFDTHWLDPRHYGPLLAEGLEQSGDTRRPEVLVRRRFRPFVEDELDGLCGTARRLAAHPDGARLAAAAAAPAAERVVAAVGPEGGWTDFELGLLEARGFTRVSLGWRILRSDTAAIAMLALAHQLAGGAD